MLISKNYFNGPESEITLSPESMLILNLLLAELKRTLKKSSTNGIPKTLGCRCDNQLYAKVNEVAKRHGISISQLLRRYVRAGLIAETYQPAD